MNLIMTMAGRYMRFINEGYKIPKYLLPWGERSILYGIINELIKNGNFENVYLVANKRDEVYMPHVRKIMQSLNIPSDNLFLISDTSGQVETALKGIENISQYGSSIRGPVVFHNIDTILYNRDFGMLKDVLSEASGYIDIFRSSHHNYSYVFVDNGVVQTIAEKIVISDQATSGLYAFASADVFLSFCGETDRYISDVYQKMIDKGEVVKVSNLYTENETIVLGTPSEYLAAGHMLDLS